MYLKKLVRKLRNYRIFEPLFYIGKSENVKRYREIRKRLEKKDKAYTKDHPELIPLHEKLNRLKKKQMEGWESIVYCDGYFYQGYKRIGINGIKPTEERIEKYGIKEFFSKDSVALDIGSNAGFLTCYLSDFFEKVDGIELNPYLIEMGEVTKKFLERENIEFISDDFIGHQFKSEYDVVFSLSNHHTIDGNLEMGFESYIKKIYEILGEDGILFFESHDIDGGDADLEEKFKIASKYFELVDHKMVRAFFDVDIDKLFAIFRRKNEKSGTALLDFSLDEARSKYHY